MSLRPEPFGALAYDFVTRKLSFLKSPTLVDVVRRLGDAADVEDALLGAGVPAAERTRTSTRSAPSPPAASSASGWRMTITASGPTGRLVDLFEYGLDAPICLTWELTYALQPRLRALPSLVRTARPGRADRPPRPRR